MSRLRLPITTIDVVAIAGVVALAIGIGYRIGWDVAVAVVGALLLLYAIFASRSEVSP